MMYSPITCCAATHWASTAHGMRRPQHKKAVGAFRPLERGLKQVLLSLGVSGDGGVPLRLGMRDGKTSDSVERPGAMEACLARCLQGVHGVVADSKAYSCRT